MVRSNQARAEASAQCRQDVNRLRGALGQVKRELWLGFG
jgi:hypothetical protein